MKRPRSLLIFAGFAVVLALLLLLPLAVVVHSAFAPSRALGIESEQWVAGAGAGRAFRLVLDTYGGHLRNSGVVALLTGGLALLFGVPCGLVLGSARTVAVQRACRAIEVLLTLPLGLPGLVVAMALLVAYPGWGGDLGLLLLGHVLYTLPFVVRTVAETTRARALPSLWQAAQTLGATLPQRASRVAWPVLRRAVAGAALLTLTLSFGEFNVTFLLATPARGTFPMALYLTYTNNSFPVAAAATTVFLAALLPLLCLTRALGEQGHGRPEQGA